MAYGDDRDNFFDNNNDGVDDDYDHRPGNSSNSSAYAERYDYGDTSEYMVNGAERADQIQAAQIRRQQHQEAKEKEHSAQGSVHYWPNVGKFIIPEENTWAAHAALVKDDRTGLHFNPEKHVHFDQIIADKAGIPALYDENNPDFDKYEGLRTNLEVLRNDIIGIYLNDGSYDPGDEVYIPQIRSIAEAIGESLGNDGSLVKRALGYKAVDIDIANIEGVGAAAIYEYLEENQRKPAFFQALRDRLNDTFGLPPDRIWQLPPMEETPYSPENLAAPPPKTDNPLAESILERHIETEHVNDREDRIAQIAELAIMPLPAMSVVEMEDASKEASVEEARRILRNLRNLEFGDKGIEEWLDTGTPDTQAEKAESLAKLGQIYALQNKLDEAKNPDHVSDMFTEDGEYSGDAFKLAVAEWSLRNLPKDHELAPQLEGYIFNANEEAKERLDQPLERMLDNLSTGLERVSGQEVYDQSPADRLVSISNRIQKKAKKLRSVDKLDPPARAESVELAHEILRRLKDMEMSNKPVTEFIENAPADEKAAVAQKMDEVADMYKNLVSEATLYDPELLRDKRIQEGVDAVQEFAHSVKLMAAKEIPNSIASAQQIGADVTQDPEEWDMLHDHTVERLVTSMEGGLEEAVGAIEVAEEMAEDLAEEQMREASEAVIFVNGHRKKKKRYMGSGDKHGKRQEKIAQDLRADDRATGQGRFADEDDNPLESGRNFTAASIKRQNQLDRQLRISRNLAADDNMERPPQEQYLETGPRYNQDENLLDERANNPVAGKDSEKDRSGMTDAQKRNIRLAADDMLTAKQGRWRADAMPEGQKEQRNTRSASQNSRFNRMGRSDLLANQQQQVQRQDKQQEQQLNTNRQTTNRNANMGTNQQTGGDNKTPTLKGMDANKLASIKGALSKEGNTLLHMNDEARAIPTATSTKTNPARTDLSSIEREEMARNNPNRPRGTERT